MSVEEERPPRRRVDMLRTIVLLALLALAVGGAIAQAVRGERPALLRRSG
jgi:hypothetical protein